MAMTDPIADMLTRIRNGGIAKHAKVDIPLSKVKVAIANVLKETGFVKNYKVITEDAQGVLRVYLKYDVNNLHVINEIKRISKPGRRTYVGKEDIPQVKNGFGCAILTTCKGVISDTQARQDGVGGEIICTVW